MASVERAHLIGQMQKSSGSRQSTPYSNLQSLPEDLELLEIAPSLSITSAPSFESARTDNHVIDRRSALNHFSNRPRTAPESPEKKQIEDLAVQNSNFRSARYLSMQWSSRSTQWDARSSMRSFKDPSSKQSKAPPALREYHSDSDSDSDNGSIDESVQSQVSEAHKMIESWKNRPLSGSSNGGGNGSFNGNQPREDSLRSTKTEKTKNSLSRPSDEFGMANSFDFAFSSLHVESSSTSAVKDPISSDQYDDPMRPIESRVGIAKEIDIDVLQDVFGSQRTSKTSGGNDRGADPKSYLEPAAITAGGFLTPDIPLNSFQEDQSPRTVIISSDAYPNTSLSYEKEMIKHQSTLPEPLQNHNNEYKEEEKQEVHTVTPKKLIRSSEKSLPPAIKPIQSLKSPPPTISPLTTVAKQSHTNDNTNSTVSTPTSEPKAIIKNIQAKIRQVTPELKLRKEQKKIVWDVFEFVFTFSLLTCEAKVPPTGDYTPDEECSSFKCKLKFRSKLLHNILNRFAVTLRRIRSSSNENGKFMICPSDCTPAMKHVHRDGE
jgi:hypothetical protein